MKENVSGCFFSEHSVDLHYVDIMIMDSDNGAVCSAFKVSRIFAANMLLDAASLGETGWSRDVMDNLYLLTSDADLWPISSSAYHLPDGINVLSLNAFCCGTFKHGAETCRMIPMANVGARVVTWRNLTNR